MLSREIDPENLGDGIYTKKEEGTLIVLAKSRLKRLSADEYELSDDWTELEKAFKKNFQCVCFV